MRIGQMSGQYKKRPSAPFLNGLSLALIAQSFRILARRIRMSVFCQPCGAKTFPSLAPICSRSNWQALNTPRSRALITDDETSSKLESVVRHFMSSMRGKEPASPNQAMVSETKMCRA